MKNILKSTIAIILCIGITPSLNVYAESNETTLSNPYQYIDSNGYAHPFFDSDGNLVSIQETAELLNTSKNQQKG